MNRRTPKGAAVVIAMVVVVLVGIERSSRAEKQGDAAAPRPAMSLSSMQVMWSKTALTGVLDVFPHPALARRAVLVRESGLMISDNWGKSFQELEQASAARVGVIRSIAFDPDRTDVFYAAGDKGVWLTADNGKTFEQIGVKSRGMAADETVGVWVYPGDPSNRTLLAAHGREASGLSVTFDAGAKWQVLCPGLFVYQAVVGLSMHEVTPERTLLFIAAAKDTPDVFRLYCSTVLGEEPVEEMRDFVPAGTAVSVMTDPPDAGFREARCVYLATADAGLYYLSSTRLFSPQKVETPSIASWSSIGLTVGPAPDTQLLYGYDTAKLGLVMSLDSFQTVTSAGRGLPTGPFVREGARIRAGLGGCVFYAAANGSLYLGTVWGPGMILSGVEVAPALVSFSRDAYQKARDQQRQQISMLLQESSAAAAARRLQEAFRKGREAFPDAEFSVRAKVVANSKPASVVVDLSAVDGADAEPMHDDGKHDDGEAGDGIYGARFLLNLGPQKNWQKRNHWPGLVGLPITVTSATGRTGTAAGVATIRARSDDAVVWDDPYHPGKHDAEGGATAEIVESDIGVQSGRRALSIAVAGGAWNTAVRRQGDVASLTAYAALTFWVKTEGNLKDELFVQLRDEPQIGLSETTRPVPVVGGKYLEGGTLADDWRQVSIPVERLLSGSGSFQPALFSHVIFSGEGRSPGTYWIDAIRLVRPEKSNEP